MDQEQSGTYAKLELNKKFSDYYTKLKNQTTGWAEVEDNTILQPDSAKKGDRYLVAIRGEGNVVEAKFLVSDYSYTPEYETQDKVMEEPVKLPSTYDSIALIIILVAIVVGIIIVAILRKRNKENN